MQRIIGTFEGGSPGHLLICTAGLHGNELAGIKALEYVFKMLEVEHITNPQFQFHGRLVGIAGNIQAMEQGKRYIKQDMNRMWMPDNVARIRRTPPHLLEPEERELRDMVQHIDEEMAHRPEAPVVVLDLHTTTADGGIFCIATEDPESVRIASELHAPVILGMLHGIRGTTMHYFRREVIPRDITAFAFESGQHEDPKSVNRSIAAIIACLRALDMVDPKHVESVHDQVLIDYSAGLPRIAELIQAYQIQDEESFEILPDFRNFQPVTRGQLLAYDAGQAVHAIEDSLILMPRYQKLGDDGYFLLRVLVD